MALEVDIVFDVHSIKFPGYNFLFILNQSSGHDRVREGLLNINLTSVKFGGKHEKLRNTNIHEIGPYQGILKVGD